MANSTFAQQTIVPPVYTFWNTEMQAIAKPESKPGWIYFKDDFTTAPQDIFTTHAAAFGLGQGDSMVLVKTKIDALGIEHYWFEHYFLGYKVEYDEMVIHKKNSRSYLCNGNISELININPVANNDTVLDKISIANQLSINTSSIIYIENLFFRDENNVVSFNSKYYVLNDSMQGYVYYNLNSNSITKNLTNINQYEGFDNERSYYPYTGCHTDSVSRVEIEIDTSIYGVAGSTIYVYDSSMVYYFIDSLRSNGIFTYVNKKVIIGNSPYFISELASSKYHIPPLDPYIQCHSDITPLDKRVLNLYFGTQNVSDFLNEKYNIHSVMGANPMYLIAGTPSSPLSSRYGNLSAEGINAEGVKIDINGHSIAVVAHEWGHALSINYGANFAPFGESSMLGEGFSDIFALTVQFYANDKHNLGISDPTWLGYPSHYFFRRSLASPKSIGSLYPLTGVTGYASINHPDYYQGENWQGTGFQYSIDPTHHNSTVFSHWYYLITEGGTKTNEVGDTYQLTGMGLDNAFDLLMYAVTTGLATSTSDFLDMRRATIQATIDLYGYCEPLLTVINAWDAVGVYDSLYSGFYPPNNYVNATINNDVILSDTVNILGYLKVSNNSTISFNSANVFLAPFSEIEISSNCSFEANQSEFNCGLYSTINIEPGGNLSSSLSTYQFDSTICFPADSFYNLWLGINFKSSNNSVLNLIRNNFKGAFCAVYAHHNSSNYNPNISFLANQFTENMKALYLKGVSSPQNVSFNNIIESNYFDNPWKIQSDVIFDLPDEYESFLLYSYVQIDNLKNTEIKYNTIGSINNNLTLTTLPLGGGSSLPITGPITNPIPYVQSNLGMDLNSTTTDVLYKLYGNTFKNLSVALNIHCEGTAEIKQNSFINNQKLHNAPLINAVGCTLLFDSCLIDDSGVGLNLVNNISSEIKNCTFKKTNQNIYLHGGSDNTIKNNNFVNTMNSNALEGFGIHNYGSLSCTVRDNEFSGAAPYYIVFDNTGSQSSYLFNNTFHSAGNIAVQTDNDNSGLKIKCNTFAADGEPHWIGLFHIDGSLADQGLNCTSGDNYQAGNEWKDNALSSQYPLQNDIVLGPSATAFNYYAHTYLDGFPNLKTTDPRKNNLPTNPIYKFVCDGVSRPLQVKTTNSCIDIYNGWYRPANEGILNTDLLDKLNDLINIRNTYLTELSTLQSQLYNPETQRDLSDKIISLQTEVRLVNDGIIEIYKIAGNEAAAISLLESESSVEAKMKLYEEYSKAADYANAARVLNEIQQIYNPAFALSGMEADIYEDNRDYYIEMAHIEQDLHNEGRSIYELNAAEKQSLENIVLANVPLSAKAEVLLAYNNVPLYQRSIKKLPEAEMNELLYGNNNNFDYNLNITPNPAGNQIDVCFNLPANATNVKLKLIDEYNRAGMLLELRTVNEGELCKQFNISAYAMGTYRIVLEHDNFMATGAHLLIQR